MFMPLLCVSLVVVPLLIANMANVPCILGDKVPQAKSKCGTLPFKISEGGGLRDPVASDNNKRVKTQDPAPDAAVPSPIGGGWSVVVTLYAAAIEPTIVPCLGEDLIVEAKAKLGDVPMKVREESDPAGVYRAPTAADDIRKVKSQNLVPATAIGRPLSTSYFVGVSMYPIPPPPEPVPPEPVPPEPVPTNGKQSWLWWALGAFAFLLLLLALKKIFGSSGS